MINKLVVKQKVELLLEDIALLKRVENNTFEELAHDDPFLWNGVQHILQKIIGRGIDINQHIIAELESSTEKAPIDYTETFLRLAKLNVLPEPFAQEIAKSAGFRNAIVHEYNHLDEGIVYTSVSDAIMQYSRYCDYVLQFTESVHEKKGM